MSVGATFAGSPPEPPGNSLTDCAAAGSAAARTATSRASARPSFPMSVKSTRPIKHLVATAELAVVPGGDLVRDELHADALGRLLGHHLADGVAPAGRVAREDLRPQVGDDLDVAVHDDVGLDHHAAELVVGLARLDLQRRAIVALEVAHLLRLRVGPGPELAGADDVPERHEVRPPVPPVGGAHDDALLVEEGGQLLLGHPDLVAAAHRRTA